MKNKINACDTCNIEPPAMKFKCPECEYTPEEKQIIIDGVNVAGCNYYANYGGCLAEKDGYGDILLYCKEKEMHDCYYKQLKRKEQECEELKKERNKYKKQYRKNRLDRKKYQQALEKIEEIVNQDIAFMGHSDEFDDLILNEINEVKGVE